jgi:hypothetical protein
MNPFLVNQMNFTNLAQDNLVTQSDFRSNSMNAPPIHGSITIPRCTLHTAYRILNL